MARRKIEQALRPRDRRLRSDGFLRIMPADSAYDLRRAQRLIWGEQPPAKLEPLSAPASGGSAEAGDLLPGVKILQQAVAALPPPTRTIFLLLPFHARLLPEPGSAGERTLEDCKAAIAKLAERRNGWVFDSMWRSAWALDDSNFWDAYHFRDSVCRHADRGRWGALEGGAPRPSQHARVARARRRASRDASKPGLRSALFMLNGSRQSPGKRPTPAHMKITVQANSGEFSFECEATERLLYAGLAQGLRLPYECATGTCGTCRGRVVQGSTLVEWDEAPGFARLKRAKGDVLMCQARPTADCVLRVPAQPRRRS